MEGVSRVAQEEDQVNVGRFVLCESVYSGSRARESFSTWLLYIRRCFSFGDAQFVYTPT